jgi:hypothetical protein
VFGVWRLFGIWCLVFGACLLFGAWNLVLEIWNLWGFRLNYKSSPALIH